MDSALTLDLDRGKDPEVDDELTTSTVSDGLSGLIHLVQRHRRRRQRRLILGITLVVAGFLGIVIYFFGARIGNYILSIFGL